MVAPPGQLHELLVGRAAEDNRVAVGKFLVETAEFGKLGRANEGEVLWIEKDDLPLARKAGLGDLLEGGLAIFLVFLETRLNG